MLFIVHGDGAKTLRHFEAFGGLPNKRERERLERDLAELEAAAERVRKVLAAPPARERQKKPRRAK